MQWMRAFFLLLGSASFLLGDEVKVDTSPKQGISLPGGGVIRYHASAFKTGETTSKFQLTIQNLENQARTFIVCSMHGLKRAEIDHDAYRIKKNSALEWECVDLPDAFYTGDNAPPSAHFGCHRIQLQAKDSTNDKGERTDEWKFQKELDWEMPITDDDIGKAYIDFLKDCPLTSSCDTLKADRKPGSSAQPFLVPGVPEDRLGRLSDDWVNTWGLGDAMRDLQSSGTRLNADSWPSANWVHMGDSLRRQDSPYPARLRGTLEGAPAGSTLRFAFHGSPGGSYTVPPDPANTPCGGLPVSVEEDFLIPVSNSAEDGYTLEFPEECGVMDDGSVVRFNAQVVARAGTPCRTVAAIQYQDWFLPLDQLFLGGLEGCGEEHWHALGGAAIATDGALVTDPGPECGYGKKSETPVVTLSAGCYYNPGDLMYLVDSVLVKDTAPPQITDGPKALFVTSSTLRVEVEVVDAITPHVGVMLCYSVNAGPEREIPMVSSSPLFAATVDDLVPGDRVTYQVRTVDEFGNAEITAPHTLVVGEGAMEFRRGDANMDGEMDISDAVAILTVLFLGGAEFLCVDAADSNDDDNVDISDGITILGYLFLGEADIPDPGPKTCGPDPTGDELSCLSYSECS